MTTLKRTGLQFLAPHLPVARASMRPPFRGGFCWYDSPVLRGLFTPASALSL